MTLFRPERRVWDAQSVIKANESRIGGRRWAGVAVNDESALRHTAVWGCTDLISELVSTLPVDEYKRSSDGVRVPLALSPLLTDPAGDGSGYEVWCRQLMMSLLFRGNGYGLILGVGSDGWPTQIESLHPDRVSWRQDRTGILATYLDNQSVDRWPLGPLWHMPAYVMPGSPVGLSPIRYAAETIGVGLAAQKFGAQWFGDGAHPTSVFESDQPINQTQADEIKDRIVKSTTDSRSPLVLGAGGKLRAIQVSPEESQFLETMKANADDIARFFFRRPPGEGGAVTYANVEARSLDLLTYTLGPWLVRVEKALTRLRPRPRFVKINADALIRVDLASRYKAHDTAIRTGWKSRNDARRDEDLAPIPDGNEYLWPPYATMIGAPNDGPAQPA